MQRCGQSILMSAARLQCNAMPAIIAADAHVASDAAVPVVNSGLILSMLMVADKSVHHDHCKGFVVNKLASYM